MRWSKLTGRWKDKRNELLGDNIKIDRSLFYLLILILAIIMSLWLRPVSLFSFDIPPEPPFDTNHDWNLAPNGLFIFTYDTDNDGKPDLITKRRILPEGRGWAHSEIDIKIEAENWPKGLFIYYFDGGAHQWRWFAIERYPLFYVWKDMVFLDSEEDGVNGNESAYENLFETKKKIKLDKG